MLTCNSLSEVEEPDLHKFPNLAAFFYRTLKPGARPLDPNPNAVLSPADGKVISFGTIEDGARTSRQPPRLLGRPYSTRVMPDLDYVSVAQPRHRDALRSFVVVRTISVCVRRRLGCRHVLLASLLAASVGCTTLVLRPMSIAYGSLDFDVAMSRALRSRCAYDIGSCPVCRGACMHLHLRPHHSPGGFPAILYVFSCVREIVRVPGAVPA